jgi:hypothetical protein
VIASIAAPLAVQADERSRTKVLEFDVSEDMTRFVFDKDVAYDSAKRSSTRRAALVRLRGGRRVRHPSRKSSLASCVAAVRAAAQWAHSTSGGCSWSRHSLRRA